MGVLIRNETAKPWVFEGSRGDRQVAAGAIAFISDEEWGSVISAKRGPGQLHAIDFDPGARLKMNFEYFSVGAAYEALYVGTATQEAADADPVWTIKKFAYQTFGSDNRVTQVQVLDSVPWTNRGSLPWT